MDGVFVRWLCTLWCNYKCPYCRQDHRRDAVFDPASADWMDNESGGRPPGKAHWADNAMIEEWLAAFERHFSRTGLVMTMTGGEPMLDKKNTVPLLEGLTKAPWCKRLRIDSNASWNPFSWGDVDKNKIVLMLSFHESEISEQDFVWKVNSIRTAGWNVGFVTIVPMPGQVDRLKRLAEKLHPVPLTAMPAYGSLASYSAAQILELQGMTPEQDWPWRSGSTTLGKLCHYPSLAYEMNPDGALTVACHQSVGSLFDPTLPALFADKVPCPHKKCTCVDRYVFMDTFAHDLFPIDAYASRLKSLKVI